MMKKAKAKWDSEIFVQRMSITLRNTLREEGGSALTNRK